MRKNWSEARESCLNKNGDLVSIKNEDEDKFVAADLKDNLGDQVTAWIGIKDGSEVWSDGYNITYEGNIVVLAVFPPPHCYTTSGTMNWSLRTCSDKLRHAICKRRGLCKDH